MKEKIEQLSKGNFIYELPRILLSEEALDICVETGSTYQGSFTIRNSEGTRMKGVLYSTNRLLTLETDKFIAEVSNIRYHFSADYLSAGDEFKEEISIISDCGEISIPVTIHIEAPYCNTTLGKMKDMFQFANLAKTDWNEAKQVFKSDKFAKVLEYYDKQNLLLYKSLLKSSSISQALDEFLIATHKKVQNSISIDKTDLVYEAGPYNFMDKLTITKSNWGYTEIKISSQERFIELDKRMLWSDNFVNNECEIGFVIKTEDMKEGKHTGKIIVETIYQRLEVNITVNCNRQDLKKRNNLHRRKRLIQKLMSNYIEFRLNHIAAAKYVVEAQNYLLGLMTQEKENPMFELYQLHLYLMTGKETAMVSAFSEVDKKAVAWKKENPRAYAIYIYLKSLRKRTMMDVVNARNEVNDIYKRDTGDTMVFWCLLYLDQRYETNHMLKYSRIKEQVQEGNTSPILYYEALVLLNDDPSLMKELSGFEQQIVMFALRHNCLNKEVALQTAYLAGREKAYSKRLVLLLRMLFEQYKYKDVLQSLCCLLIRGNQIDKRYNQYYEDGLNQQLRVSQLPEFYVYSLGEETYVPLNPTAVSYFNFNNNLNDTKKAYYYACLIKQDKSEGQLLKKYLNEMKVFLIRELQEGIINENLAVICDYIYENEPVDQNTASLLTDVAFTYALSVENPRIKAVAVVHKELMDEHIVPVQNQKAYIQMYSDDVQIFLIDESEQRYYTTIDYSYKKLLHLEAHFEKMYQLVPDNPKLILYLSDKAQYYQKFDDETAQLRKKVAMLDNLNIEYRRSYIQTLIHYYYDNFEGDILENYLMQIDLHNIERAARSKIMEFMIVRDLYNTAIKAMSELGFDGIDVKRLLKLCSRMISNADKLADKEDILVEIAYYVFEHGKYDVPVLEYLVRYYYGTTKRMYDLWKCAKENNLDTADLEERLLGQMLFSESYMGNAKPVFMNYYRSGCNHKLVRAFLSYYSYKYLLFDRIAEPELFDTIKKELSYEDNEIALLAWLKFESGLEQIPEADIKFIDYQLGRFEQKNICFPFFKEFQKHMRIPQTMVDKYYIEYHTNPRNKVILHYVIENDLSDSEFKTEELKDAYYGIFIKSFILFDNESLQYYVTEITPEGESITESRTIHRKAEAGYEESNFERLNQIIEARELNDDTTLNRLLEAYVKMNYKIDELFHEI